MESVARYLDHVAGALVLLNSVLLMLQLEMEGRHIAHSLGLHAERQNFDGILPTFQVMDSVFVFIFLAELLIRIVLERWKFVKATCRGWGLQGFLECCDCLSVGGHCKLAGLHPGCRRTGGHDSAACSHQSP